MKSSLNGLDFFCLVFYLIFSYISLKEYIVMDIALFFIHKFFVFTFILAVLYVLLEIFTFGVAIFTNGDYKISGKRLIWLGIAVAHIITTLLTGFII